MHAQWSLKDAAEQAGRIAVVTGANTGLGFETAQALAGLGARVVLACRNPGRAEQARRRILARFPAAQLEVRLLDTGSLASVRAFAAGFLRDQRRLDLLVNNAGIMMTPRFETPDGIEGQLGVNHLGHFLLTGLLLPALSQTPRSRVVSLYSVAANWGGIQFDDLQFAGRYDAVKAYAQSKLACLMFGLELDLRLRRAGLDTRSLAAHPGYSQSDLSRHLSKPIQLMLSLFGSLIMQSTVAGALPTLRAALDESLNGGAAIGPAGRKQTKGPPVVVSPVPAALDPAQRARLWAVSEALCGLRYALPSA